MTTFFRSYMYIIWGLVYAKDTAVRYRRVYTGRKPRARRNDVNNCWSLFAELFFLLQIVIFFISYCFPTIYEYEDAYLVLIRDLYNELYIQNPVLGLTFKQYRHVIARGRNRILIKVFCRDPVSGLNMHLYTHM